MPCSPFHQGDYTAAGVLAASSLAFGIAGSGNRSPIPKPKNRPGGLPSPRIGQPPYFPGHTKRPATGLKNLQRVGSHLSLNTARYGLANETHEHNDKPDSCRIISLPALIIAAFLVMGAAVRGIVDVQAVNADARYPLSLVLAGLLSIACF